MVTIDPNELYPVAVFSIVLSIIWRVPKLIPPLPPDPPPPPPMETLPVVLSTVNNSVVPSLTAKSLPLITTFVLTSEVVSSKSVTAVVVM